MNILYTPELVKIKVRYIAQELKKDIGGYSCPIFIGVLNGSIVFFTDLIRECDFNLEVDFCKVDSYYKNEKRDLKFVHRWDRSLKDKCVVVVEDIVDSGETIKELLREIEKEEPYIVKVVSLLKRKTCSLKINYIGFELEDDRFVYGYGLDNCELKRNLKGIYYD